MQEPGSEQRYFAHQMDCGDGHRMQLAAENKARGEKCQSH